MLRQVGKVTVGVVPAVALARLGLPALGVLVFLAVLAAGVGCWVIASKERAERVNRLLLAWRGNVGCLSGGTPAAPRPIIPHPRRWPWRRP
ncbi:MAG: hypothetical protein M3Z75_32185 [Actinomycetota bacterium]|nr:hypothetical protein [Actinomycetota bacterium]